MGSMVKGHILKTRVYVDGYNLYYGCLKGTPYKWLDLLALFERQVLPSINFKIGSVSPQIELQPVAVKYFTAKILEQAAAADDSVSSQAHYFNALDKLHSTRIQRIEGYYSLSKANVRIVDVEDKGKKLRDCPKLRAWKLEEKQSDVNLALHLYQDAMAGEVDQVVAVTNDTDIEPALSLIRKQTEVIVGLVIPTSDQRRVGNTSLARHAHWVQRRIHTGQLAAAQLPRVINGGKQPTTKPISWYANATRLQKIIDLSTTVLEKRQAVFRWLDTPNHKFFDAKTPLELIESGDDGANAVEAYICKYIHEVANAEKRANDALPIT
jgi:6-hydroxy-3-succinoylpyridine 3-monooxygenase